MSKEIKKLDKNIFELKCSAFKGEGYTLWKLRKNWELITGNIIAEKSEPKNLYMRELTINVHDPVIHHSIVSYSSIIMKKINEFFQGNVVEKIEVRKINRNSGRNILDLRKQKKTENTTLSGDSAPDALNSVEDLVGPVNSNDVLGQEIELYRQKAQQIADTGRAQNVRMMVKWGTAVAKQVEKIQQELANGGNMTISEWNQKKAELDISLAKATNE